MFSDGSSQIGETKDMTTWIKSSQDDQLQWLRQGRSGGQVSSASGSAAQPAPDQQVSSNSTLGPVCPLEKALLC